MWPLDDCIALHERVEIFYDVEGFVGEVYTKDDVLIAIARGITIEEALERLNDVLYEHRVCSPESLRQLKEPIVWRLK